MKLVRGRTLADLLREEPEGPERLPRLPRLSRVHDLVSPPGLTTLCAGYEAKKWRCKALADHLIEWLPEFALKHSERERFGSHNGVALLREAARSIYTSVKYQNRGELGEILLHIAMRQVFKTAPAVAKYFFKDSANNTVKGFDAAHQHQNPPLPDSPWAKRELVKAFDKRLKSYQ